MLNFLLAHKIAIGRVLSVVGATATVVIFEYFLELAWYIAIPVGAFAYITMPLLWTGVLDLLLRPKFGVELGAVVRFRVKPPAAAGAPSGIMLAFEVSLRFGE